MIGRVTEWEFGSIQGLGLTLIAEAQYARGSMPSQTEIEKLDRGFKVKFPYAEFVLMRRLFVQFPQKRYTRVIWHLEWKVFDAR